MGCLPAYLLACLIWAHVLIVHMCVVQGVYFNPDCHTDLDHMDHAVTLVGYGTTEVRILEPWTLRG